jgi:hypothetical protein
MSGAIAELYANIGASVGGLEKGLATAKTLMTSTRDQFISSLSRMGGADKEFNEAFRSGWEKASTVASGAAGVLTGDYEKLGSVLGALPGPIGVVGGAIGDFVGKAIGDTARYADTVDKLSQKIGESAQFTSSFIEASDDLRVSQDTVNNSLSILSKNLGGVLDADSAAATGGRGLTAVFHDQGIKVGTYSETLFNLADRIHEIGPGMESSRLATQAFGRAGQEMLPVLLEGSERIKAMMKSAVDMGLALDDKGVKGMKAAAKAADDLNDRWAAVERKAAVALTPALLDVSSAVAGYLDKANDASSYTDIFSRAVSGVGAEVALFGGLLLGTNKQMSTTTDKIGMGTLKLVEYQQALLDVAGPSAETAAAMSAMNAQIAFQTQSSERLTEKQRDLIALGDRLQAGTAGNVAAYHEYSDASQALVDRQQDVERVMTAAAVPWGTLAEKIGLVTGAIDGSFGKMTKLQEAQTAVKLATGQTTVAQVETELATRALTKSYLDGKVSLDQFVKSSKDLATGNTAEPFFALQKAGGKANVEVVGVVKQLRDVEGAAGVADKSTLSYADSLKIVTTSYQKTTAGTQTAQDALTKYTATQITNSAAVADAKKQYDQHKITLDQYAATKATAITSDQNAKTALDAVKKSVGDTGGAWVSYSRVVDTAATNTANLGEKAKADEDAFNRSTTSVQNFGTAISRLPSATPSVLPSEVTMHAFDSTAATNATRTAAGAIPAGAAEGITENQQQAIDAMTGMATKMQDAFRSSWGMHSPSTVAAGFMNDIGLGMTGGLDAATPGVVGAFSSLRDAGAGAFRDGPWTEVGALAGDQIIAGVNSKASVLRATITGIVRGIIDGELGNLGYGSGKGRALGAP